MPIGIVIIIFEVHCKIYPYLNIIILIYKEPFVHVYCVIFSHIFIANVIPSVQGKTCVPHVTILHSHTQKYISSYNESIHFVYFAIDTSIINVTFKLQYQSRKN